MNCPACGGKGKAVGLRTVKALLTRRAMRRLVVGDFFFCGNADCEVVYFSGGQVFREAEVRVPVFPKRRRGAPVCYCFGFGWSAIREAGRRGDRRIIEFIRRRIAEKACGCDLRNPQGSCCLGNVEAVWRGEK